jgi:hypothetical protein
MTEDDKELVLADCERATAQLCDAVNAYLQAERIADFVLGSRTTDEERVEYLLELVSDVSTQTTTIPWPNAG